MPLHPLYQKGQAYYNSTNHNYELVVDVVHADNGDWIYYVVTLSEALCRKEEAIHGFIRNSGTHTRGSGSGD